MLRKGLVLCLAVVLCFSLMAIFATSSWAAPTISGGTLIKWTNQNRTVYWYKPSGGQVFTFKPGDCWYRGRVTINIPVPVQEPAPVPVQEPAPVPEPEPEPPATPPSNQAFLLEEEALMLSLINQERAKAGIGALTAEAGLTDLARQKSQDMIENNYFSHTSPTYGSPFDMMKAAGIQYKTAGENIAGASQVARAHEALMNSPGHRKNI